MTTAAYHHVIRAPGDPYSPGDPEADPPVPVTPAALAGKRGHVRLVASLSSEAAMGHLTGEYSILGTWPFTLDDTGRWDLDLDPNSELDPANTVYVEVVTGRGGQESDPLFFLADPAGGDITSMRVPAPDDLPITQYAPLPGSVTVEKLAADTLALISGAGAVESVNGRTGAVVNLAEAADLAAEVARAIAAEATKETPAGAMAKANAAVVAAAAASQPRDDDLTAIADLATMPFGRSLLTVPDAEAARAALDIADGGTSGPYVPTLVVPDAGDAIALPSPETAIIVDLTLTEDCTGTLPSGFSDEGAVELLVRLRQDDIGGWDLTWIGDVAWRGGSPPAIDSAALAVTDVSLLTLDGGATWEELASSSVADFNAAVRSNPLDLLSAPTSPLNLGTQRIINAGNAVDSQDLVPLAQVEALAGGAVALVGPANPRWYGLSGWTFDFGTASTNIAMTAGTRYFAQISNDAAVCAKGVLYVQTATTVVATAGQCWLCLHNASGAVVAQTDISALLATTGEKDPNLVASGLVPGADHYISFLWNGTGTLRLLTGNGSQLWTNLPKKRHGISGTGQTAAGAINLATATASLAGLIAAGIRDA